MAFLHPGVTMACLSYREYFTGGRGNHPLPGVISSFNYAPKPIHSPHQASQWLLTKLSPAASTPKGKGSHRLLAGIYTVMIGGGGLVSRSCLTLCDPMDYSPPGSSVRGILQARILEWVAIPFSRGSSQPRDWVRLNLSLLQCRRILYHPSHQGSPNDWIPKLFCSGFSWKENDRTLVPTIQMRIETFLVVQWLRICLSLQGKRVQSLVREDSTCLGATKPVRHNCWAYAQPERACVLRWRPNAAKNKWIWR